MMRPGPGARAGRSAPDHRRQNATASLDNHPFRETPDGQDIVITPASLVGFTIACALGGSARLLMTRLLARGRSGTFPLPTLAVNLSGAFLAGLLYAGLQSDTTRLLWLVGFCGCYTTVSTFALDTVRLARSGSLLSAALNLGLSLCGSLLAVVLGLQIGGLWQ